MSELTPGIYEQLISKELEQQLQGLDPALVIKEAIDAAELDTVLSRYLASITHRALGSMKSGPEGSDAALRKVTMINALLEHLSTLSTDAVDADDAVSQAKYLHEIRTPLPLPGGASSTPRPELALSESALLVNGRGQPRIGTEIQKELASADGVDLLCAFIKWQGVRVLEDDLIDFVERRRSVNPDARPLRVITTTYMGATDRRALDRLAALGADIKISYDTRMTRLHAKAWLFRRSSQFSTAYVGSSNLSRSAMLDGLEWNVRLSAVQQSHLLDTFAATFDEYWEDPAFERYDPSLEEHRDRLDRALAGADPLTADDQALDLATFDIRPWGYQREILEELDAEREIHGHHKNLIVMATGTGKTVVAGLDYRRLKEQNQVDSLLFIAHREEILKQSRNTFRHIMNDGTFGELLVGGHRPQDWKHVFASVQSLNHVSLDDIDPGRFDMVIIDEFHHASEQTKTYARLLHHLRPKILVGLTATPERADGGDILSWFDGRISVELRLWEALERNLLTPFQYFGISDSTDLGSIGWKRGMGYNVSELTNLYTGHDARVRIILKALQDKIGDVASMRALGFCVSINHAEFMAQRFNQAGIAAVAVTSAPGSADRADALRRLRSREINIIFAVDIFNEGVDVPEIDTVLFLRPTESATVFLQQLGRGLRLADNKPCLTVLDFIGNQHREFRFDLRFRALTGTGRRELQKAVEDRFPLLPAGCHIDLDRDVSKVVLTNIKEALNVKWNDLVSELRRLGDCSLEHFLDETGLDLTDLYRPNKGGWAGLRRQADLSDKPAGADDETLGRAIGRMLHIDDLERIEFFSLVLNQDDPPSLIGLSERETRLLHMLHFDLWHWEAPIEEINTHFERLWAHESRRRELLEILPILRKLMRRVPISTPGDRPLHIHARYSLSELLAGFGITNPASSRGSGVRWIPEEQADVFWFNLQKSEKLFSPTTMYADRAISPSLFQWESQNSSRPDRGTGQRYVNHQEQGSSVHLFFRETKTAQGGLGTPPYHYAGPATYVSHTGQRPMRMIWKLDHELPADVFHEAKIASG